MRSSGSRAARLFRGALPILVTGLLGGCYTYAYAPSMPVPGTSLEVQLNDVGRVQLVNNVGPEILYVEGALASATDSELTLKVSRTRTLRGIVQPWAGEPVTLRTGQYGMVRERHFSAPRTFVLIGSVTAGFVSFAASRGLLGLGNSSGGGGEPPPNNNQ